MKVVTRISVLTLCAMALVLPAIIPAHASAAAQPAQITMYIFGGSQKIVGPDGNPHDTVVPANLVLKAGVPVRVTVINYDEGPHTITAPGLKLDVVIKPGNEVSKGNVLPVATTFTFTPAAKGNFRWYCKLPCDAGHGYWAMGMGYSGPAKEGFMSGVFVVI